MADTGAHDASGNGYDPNGDGGLTEAFVEQWRGNAYGCFSSGHKFCREVCPVMQVTRNEQHTPTAFHANIVAMEKGLVDVEDVADDYVHCTQCGACELRCPNTLFTGDFYRHRTRTVDVVKAMRALMVATGNEREGWKAWNERLAERHNEPVLGELDGGIPVSQEHVADWAEGLDIPVGGETILFVDCEAAFYRTSYTRAFAQLLQRAGRVRAHARAVVLRRPGGGDGLRRPRPQARGAQRRGLARGRREADHRPRPARLHRLHRGLPEVLRRGLRVRDRARRRARQRPRQGGPDRAHRAGRAHRDLPRPVPAEQAQGRAPGAARAAARRPRDHVRGRRPRHPVVLLLGRRRRAPDREAGDRGGDQPPPRGPRQGARGRHARQRLPVVGAAALGRGRGGGRPRGARPLRARRALGGDRGRRPRQAARGEEVQP